MQKRRRIERGLEWEVYIELAVIFCILVSLGFPGQFSKVYGEQLNKICEYGAFIAEIALIVTANARTWDEIELLNLKRKYVPLYIYVFTVTIISMLVVSEHREEAITCLRWIVTMLFAIWLQERFTMDEMLKLIAIAQGLFVLLTLFFMATNPGLRYDPEVPGAICGFVGTKNGLAIECTFGAIITILVIRNERKGNRPLVRWLALVIVQFVLVLMADATGALFTLFIALVPALLHRGGRRLPLGLMYITVNVVFLFAMLTIMPLFAGFLEAIGKDSTLTGRIPLWRQIIEVMSNHKTMTGYGFGMFWRDPIAVSMIQTGFNRRRNGFMANITSGAHNVLLEMWLNIGLLGLTTFFFGILRAFSRSEELEDSAYLFCSSVLTLLMINGLTERCLGSNYDYKVLCMFLVMAVACNQRVVAAYRLRRSSKAAVAEESALPSNP